MTTSLQHHVISQTHSSTNHLDNHLDALLDDLQTTVSRPGAAAMALSTQNGSAIMNGSPFGNHVNLPPGTSGYREVTTTVTRDTNGVPMTSREYQIEYLNPANTVTVLDDRSSSPVFDLMKNADLAGHKIQSYKTEVYDYKFSKTTSDKKMTTTAGFGGNQRAIEGGKSHMIDATSHLEKPHIQDGGQYSRVEGSETYRSETNTGRNLNELDMLLKELNSSPGDSRTTPRREQVHTIESRMEKNSGRYPDSPSTMPKRSSSATREVTFTQERSQNRLNRAQSPTLPSGTSKSPGRTINVRHEYSATESSGTRNRSGEMSPTLRRRTPSPSSGEFRPSNFSNYPISPKDLTPTRSVTTKTYNYSTSGTRRTPTPSFDEPQPYRSPSPVSFPQKRSPSPQRRSLNRSDSGRNATHQVSGESPAVTTYKYASHSREQSRYAAGGGGFEEEDREETRSRPFPSSTPIPVGDQNPPKRLDDLMASFEDSRISHTRSPHGGEYNQGTGEYTHKIEIERGTRESHDGLQRSPSFERNLRPSSVKVSQTYSQQQQQQQQQQQGQEYQNQYQQREQQFQQSQYQQREQHPGSYHKEYQKKEEYHSAQQHYPGQFQQPPQQYPRGKSQQKEQYQQSQYHTQQYQQSNQGGFQRENREQYQQAQSYQQNQQYQYQQHQQSSQKAAMNESMSASQAYRTASPTRSIAGPPVYYPPGVELFTKKEEALLNQEQSGGGGKKKGKSKSKSEKGKGGKGMTGAPMCLPVCCAAPCSIM